MVKINKSRLYKLIVLHLRRQGARRIAVFGSYARNEEKKNSDVDIMVEFLQKKSLLDLARIERELSEKTGVNIDLLTKKSISPLIISSLKRNMKVLY